jgi:hypothetical protein
VKADRVRYDHRTGDVLATGTVDTRIGGRRVRAERLCYRAGTQTIDFANLLLEGLADLPEGPQGFSRARGNGSGGIPRPLPLNHPASARLGVPWLQAASAEAEEDLSRISGKDGVRIGAGAIAIEGEAFDLDPRARRLEVEGATLRLRSPKTRVRAETLKAWLEPGSAHVTVALEGQVDANVQLAFPAGRERQASVTATGDRLEAQPRLKGSVAFVLTGSPVRLAVKAAGLTLEAPRVSGKIRGRRLLLQGDLTGRLVLAASAFPERRAARRTWVITSARSIELAPSAAARPAVWFGGETSGELPRRVVLKNVLVEGDQDPRPELVLYRPTWA